MSEPARLLLEGAAVAGDPFEPELAAAAAAASEASQAVTSEQASNLVAKTRSIRDWLEHGLSQEARRPRYEGQHEFQINVQLTAPEQGKDERS
jgi:hypothetical protein